MTSFYIPFLEIRDQVQQLDADWLVTNNRLYRDGEGWQLGISILFLYSTLYGILVMYINQRWIRNRWLASVSLSGVIILCFNLFAGHAQSE